MKKAIEHLIAEHEQARIFLDAFEEHMERLTLDPHADSREASALFEYLAEIFFVKHEEKEETILLPELFRENGISFHKLLSKLQAQHQRGQALLSGLWKALRPGEAWSEGQRAEFLQLASAWVRFTRGHLRYEEWVLFPKLIELSDEALDERIVREFAKIDDEYRDFPDASALKASAAAFVDRNLGA